jgi:hypothetical protein
MNPYPTLIITRKTRKGAENYITRLGFTPGVAQADTHWNGTEFLPVTIQFAVAPFEGEFAVYRQVRYTR